MARSVSDQSFVSKSQEATEDRKDGDKKNREKQTKTEFTSVMPPEEAAAVMQGSEWVPNFWTAMGEMSCK